MARHNVLGKESEELAVKFLIDAGFRILHRNWRYRHFEIDIIATKGDTVHFFEVKSRSPGSTGYPEENVTKKKFRSLVAGADEFMYMNPQFRHCQFNIISISHQKLDKPEIFLIPDVSL